MRRKESEKERICSLLGLRLPVVWSSAPLSFLIGQSTFSAPSYFRIFFPSTFASMPEGRPETTTVLMASGSCGSRGCNARGGFDSFFTASLSRFSLGYDFKFNIIYQRFVKNITTHLVLSPLNSQLPPHKLDAVLLETFNGTRRILFQCK